MTLATQIVHWPGKDVPACDAHAAQLKTLGQAFGFGLSSTPAAANQPVPCSNCENQPKS